MVCVSCIDAMCILFMVSCWVMSVCISFVAKKSGLSDAMFSALSPSFSLLLRFGFYYILVFILLYNQLFYFCF